MLHYKPFIVMLFLLSNHSFAADLSFGAGCHLINFADQSGSFAECNASGVAITGFFQYDPLKCLGLQASFGYANSASFMETEENGQKSSRENKRISLPYVSSYALFLLSVESGLLYFGPGVSYALYEGDITTKESLGGAAQTSRERYTGSQMGMAALFGAKATVIDNLFAFGELKYWHADKSWIDYTDINVTSSVNMSITSLGFGIGADF